MRHSQPSLRHRLAARHESGFGRPHSLLPRSKFKPACYRSLRAARPPRRRAVGRPLQPKGRKRCAMPIRTVAGAPQRHYSRDWRSSRGAARSGFRGFLFEKRPILLKHRPVLPWNRPIPLPHRPVLSSHRPILLRSRPILFQNRPILLQNRSILFPHRSILLRNRPLLLSHRPVLFHNRSILLPRRPASP